jgi:flagellar biosynthesis protein FlhB
MSAGAEDEGEKEYAPSQKRLDDSRKRGDFARSPDLISAAVLAGFVLFAFAGGGKALIGAGSAAITLLDRPEALALSFRESGELITSTLVFSIILPVLLFILVPMTTGIVALLATKGVVFSSEKIAPKLSRISPFATAKQKFGPDGLFEFAKSACKLFLIALILYAFLQDRTPMILNSMYMTPNESTGLLLSLLSDFLVLTLILTVFLGGLDYGWQMFRHVQRNRMTRKELMDEMKDSEGDPHVKGQRRQRAYDLATNQMLADVQTADVIIVNPTHYAVALKWQRGAKTAPICVAKGVDELAAQIRALAIEHAVPIHGDPPTARAVYATVPIGEPIRTEHFKAVAAAVRFAEAMRAKSRKTWKTL